MIDHKFNKIIYKSIPRSLWKGNKFIRNTKLGYCEKCKFIHVEPYPSDDYLADHYSNYEMPTPQFNNPEYARFVSNIINERNIKVIDIGCGDGLFLKELSKNGFVNLYGIDRGPGIKRAANKRYAKFYEGDILSFLKNNDSTFDLVCMVNSLEHISNPYVIMKNLYKLMKRNSYLFINVPNDFNDFQNAYLKISKNKPWFVCPPEHLNYFTFSSLRNFLIKIGFKFIRQSTIFPLEMFLLQGLDYVSDPSLGKIAHQKRCIFEKNLKKSGNTKLLDEFYELLSNKNFGRDILMIFRKC